jgi:mono/diheme cytochrome c family protein
MDSTSRSSKTGFGRWLTLVVLLGAVLAVAVYVRRGPLPAPRTVDSPVASGEPADSPLDHARQLYERNCAACHGDRGDGNGPAARFLFPKPRDFGEAQFRAVTTTNLMPSDEDLANVLRRGMPGSAMFAFGHLSELDRTALEGYVRHLMEVALVEKQRGDSRDPAELVELMKQAEEIVRPGTPIDIPADLPAAGPESVARGAKLYKAVGCAACHGDTGKGDGGQEQKNNDGTPTRPRDFTRGFFKGGHDPRQLYARIKLGMPGSPMPGSKDLPPADIGDIVNFILSLSDPAARDRVEHKRVQLVARRAAGPLGPDISEGDWKNATPVRVVVSPLWWRDYAEPALHVAALHDGQTLAIRLTWLDATNNLSAARTEEFQDMAAVQLWKGGPEPFLGMGSEAGQLDLWQWRAGWGNPASAQDNKLDDYPFDMPQYLKLAKGGLPDFRTARAAGNPLASSDRSQSASNLAAKGFGSTTFRPKASQQVTATAAWQDGRWTVVLRRPLQVGAEDGLSFAAGEACSIAFAIWDGAARDRNGQKLVSIWHDLKIE